MLLKEEFTFAKASMGVLKILLAWGFCYCALIAYAVIWPIILLLIGYHTGPRQNTPFAEAHQRAIHSFVASQGFGIGRFGKRPEFWQELSVNFEEARYQMIKLHLMGVTPEKGDRYFEQKRPPDKESLGSFKHRPFTEEEAEAVTQLRAGQPWIKLAIPPDHQYAELIRVIAPVFAQKSCLECHEVEEGTLLGAFDYWLSPVPKS